MADPKRLDLKLRLEHPHPDDRRPVMVALDETAAGDGCASSYQWLRRDYRCDCGLVVTLDVSAEPAPGVALWTPGAPLKPPG